MNILYYGGLNWLEMVGSDRQIVDQDGKRSVGLGL